MKSHFRRDTCRLCGSRQVELVLPMKPSALADAYVPAEKLDVPQDRYPMDVFLCRECAHVQLLDVVDPKILFSNYLYFTSVSLGLVEHFRKYADAVTAQISPPPGSLVIDIGSNEGVLLKFFKNHGLRVLGVDAAENIVARANQAGIETIPAFFSAALGKKIRQERGGAAIVTANNVFAHADNLPDMLDGIREVLAPDGVFVFEVVYLADMIEKLTFDTIYHEHLCFHSVKPFASFCERHGMELFHIERIPPKGGSIRGFVKIAGGPQPVNPSVRQLIALESSLGLDRPPVFQKLAAQLDELRDQLHHLLTGFRASGKTVAGYGASATVTTLIHHFELGQALDFLVDDDKTRHGLFSPGFHVPVVSSTALYERKADYTIILAWQYAAPIMKKHPGYLEQGGHFIIPMPQVQVI